MIHSYNRGGMMSISAMRPTKRKCLRIHQGLVSLSIVRLKRATYNVLAHTAYTAFPVDLAG